MDLFKKQSRILFSHWNIKKLLQLKYYTLLKNSSSGLHRKQRWRWENKIKYGSQPTLSLSRASLLSQAAQGSSPQVCPPCSASARSPHLKVKPEFSKYGLRKVNTGSTCELGSSWIRNAGRGAWESDLTKLSREFCTAGYRGGAVWWTRPSGIGLRKGYPGLHISQKCKLFVARWLLATSITITHLPWRNDSFRFLLFWTSFFLGFGAAIFHAQRGKW